MHNHRRSKPHARDNSHPLIATSGTQPALARVVRDPSAGSTPTAPLARAPLWQQLQPVRTSRDRAVLHPEGHTHAATAAVFSHEHTQTP
eukprot:1386822-Prymnesium_polylepis.2